jgi:hypothetical protein
MMHIDLTSKRAQLALRFFTYGVMTLATALLTVVAVFYAMGYRFNQNDLTFTQGGLIQFRTAPEGAQVVIDGKLQNYTTPGRANLGSGTHTVEMRLAGYRSWQKTVTLAPGQLLWLNYTRLLPDSITTSNVATLDSAISAMTSPDHKWMLVQQKPDQPLFKLVDFNDPKKPVVTDLSIPEAQLTKKDGAYGQFSIKEWDLSSRYILVDHANKDTHELLRLDRAHAANAVNVSRMFSLTIAEAHFVGSNANLLYAKTDTVLRSLDIGSSSASAALITGIGQFVVYGNDAVAYVATHDVAGGGTQQVAGIYTQGKEVASHTFAADAAIKIAYSEYTHHAYLVIDAGDGTAKILRDPTSTTKDNAEVAQVKLDKPIQWMKFSASGRMLVVGNGNDVATYDLELDKLSAWTISGAPLTQPLQWLDDYYLWTDAGGTLRIFEYDSVNDREITSVASGINASLSAEGAYLYSFGKSASGAIELQSSKLVND